MFRKALHGARVIADKHPWVVALMVWGVFLGSIMLYDYSKRNPKWPPKNGLDYAAIHFAKAVSRGPYLDASQENNYELESYEVEVTPIYAWDIHPIHNLDGEIDIKKWQEKEKYPRVFNWRMRVHLVSTKKNSFWDVCEEVPFRFEKTADGWVFESVPPAEYGPPRWARCKVYWPPRKEKSSM